MTLCITSMDSTVPSPYFSRTKKEAIHNKIILTVDCLQYLCVMVQEKLPYHLDNVKSNDSLYTDADYKSAIFQSIEDLLKEIQELIIEIGNSQGVKSVNEGLIISSCLYTINSLLVYILPCQKLKDIVKYSLANIKNSSGYFKDKTVKSGTLPGYVKNTFKNIMKNFPDESLKGVMEEIKSQTGIAYAL